MLIGRGVFTYVCLIKRKVWYDDYFLAKSRGFSCYDKVIKRR
jgi:hypothetical protein